MSDTAPSFDNPAAYLEHRLEQYRGWYDRKSVSAKNAYLRMRAFSVIGGGLVPVLINVQPAQSWALFGVPVVQAAVTVISLAVVVFVSLESVFHYREQWKNYRSTEQMLAHERVLFESGVGKYSGLSEQDAFRLLVERVEEAILSENAATLNVMTMASEAANGGK